MILNRNFGKMKKVLQYFSGCILMAVMVILLSCIPAYAEEKETIYIGDSRTVGMRSAITGVWDDSYNQLRDDYGVWVAKCGMGYQWFTNTAVDKASSYLKEGNKNLVILMGCNDMPYTDRGDTYINYIKNHESEFAANNISVYYVSVNPVGHKNGGTETYFVNDNGVIQLTNAKSCEPFNSYMEANLPSSVTYIDTYSKLIQNGYATTDGLHYTKETYEVIFSTIESVISADESDVSKSKCLSSRVYDYEYYVNHNADAAAACGTDGSVSSKTKAFAHFITTGLAEGSQASAFFNINDYMELNPSVAETYDNDPVQCLQHYLSYGYSEGRATLQEEHATIYYGPYYMSQYSELQSTYGNSDGSVNYTGLMEHFLKFGINEGLHASATFDVEAYKNNYRDLRVKYGDSTEDYYWDYAYYGSVNGLDAVNYLEFQGVTEQDGQDYSAVYDYNYFRTKYPDVEAEFGDDEVATLANFVRWGMPAGRQGSEEFNVNIYKENYPNLVATYGSNLKGYYLHYIWWGKAAGLVANERIASEPVTVQNGQDYSAVYDYDYFRTKYPDVADAFGDDDVATLANFVRWGMEGGRQGNEEFNVNIYMQNYPELVSVYGTNLKGYYMHYIWWGKDAGLIANEVIPHTATTVQNGQDYSAVYDYEYFRTKYPEVAEIFGDDDVATLANFVRWGMEGGRQGNEEFNVQIYMQNYPDLVKTYGSNLKGYYMHYIWWGKAAGLVANEVLEHKATTVQNGFDYSAVYNFDYFQTAYPDVRAEFGDDDVATLANFVRWGMPAGRQGSEEFNLEIYKANYPQLVSTYGSNNAGYYLHYCRWGQAAGLNARELLPHEATTVQNGFDYADVYDFDYFQTKYPDVRAEFGDDDVKTLANFVRWGMPAGRQGSEEFDVNIYMQNYPELIKVYGTSDLSGYYLHYIRWGKAAGLNAKTLLDSEDLTVSSVDETDSDSAVETDSTVKADSATEADSAVKTDSATEDAEKTDSVAEKTEAKDSTEEVKAAGAEAVENAATDTEAKADDEKAESSAAESTVAENASAESTAAESETEEVNRFAIGETGLQLTGLDENNGSFTNYGVDQNYDQLWAEGTKKEAYMEYKTTKDGTELCLTVERYALDDCKDLQQYFEKKQMTYDEACAENEKVGDINVLYYYAEDGQPMLFITDAEKAYVCTFKAYDADVNVLLGYLKKTA